MSVSAVFNASVFNLTFSGVRQREIISDRLCKRFLSWSSRISSFSYKAQVTSSENEFVGIVSPFHFAEFSVFHKT